ncbi:hypothetical protein H671_8g19305 [Cricetulus griseus]|nr:hypothetical protein H671_8g19305 [Cricetulus griseus]
MKFCSPSVINHCLLKYYKVIYLMIIRLETLNSGIIAVQYLGIDSFLVGPVSFVGILESALVMATGSHGGFLAVSSLRSFCRCRGLYYPEKAKVGGEYENASCAEQHSSGIPHSSDGQSLTGYLQKKKLSWRGKKTKNLLKRCLFE